MYDELKGSPSTSEPPEHKLIAIQFADDMLKRFEPIQCNEILLLIRQKWSEHRLLEIEKAEKAIAYLKESLSTL